MTHDVANLPKLINIEALYLDDALVNNIAFLSNLTELKEISCDNTGIIDITPLARLTALEFVYFNKNYIIDLSPLRSLHGLKELYCRETQVTDLAPVAGLTELRKLDCGYTHITDLAPVAGLTELRKLDCNDTHITDLSPLQGLHELQEFHCQNTQIHDLRPLAKLTALQILGLGRTQIDNLTPLQNLHGLKELYCRETKITDIGPLSTLNGLKRLDISGKSFYDLPPPPPPPQKPVLTPQGGLLEKIKKFLQVPRPDHDQTSLPREHSTYQEDHFDESKRISSLSPLKGLNALEELDFSDTLVDDLWPLAKLKSLKKIKGRNTKIHSLKALEHLTNLEHLDIKNNNITDLSCLWNKHKLTSLHCSNNKVFDLSPLIPIINNPLRINRYDFSQCPLTTPPVEIVAQGTESIINYFRERDKHGTSQLFEAKLLIVGEGGAGKTSLMRRLFSPEDNLPAPDETTKGIDIYRHDFLTKTGNKFRLNVWDFGGQEIYHATHQFFLTKRSLYVLVDDTRKDDASVHDPGFKYWLEIVDLLSDHSPVFIFQNKKGGRSKPIDLSGIRARFDNVKDLHEGDLQSSDSAKSMRDVLECYAETLPHVGQSLPSRWIDIREEIEDLAAQKPYIPVEEYYSIYSRHLSFDKTKALHLSQYLHDLGVFLHFQDNDLLQRIIFLQSSWVNNAVFSLLDDEEVKHHGGMLYRTDLKRIYKDPVYSDRIPEIRALMLTFELCYALSDKNDTWLLPQMLQPSKPDALTNWGNLGDLALRYKYEFLPKGLISRLIVRQNDLVKQPSLAWRNGALFEKEQSELLVEIGPRGNEVILQASGPSKKKLMAIISNELDTLNKSFHGLPEKVSKWIPCTCLDCQGRSNPEIYDYSHLLKKKEHGHQHIECPFKFAQVNINDLLDGIDTTRDRQAKEKALGSSSTVKKERTIKIFLASSSELKTDRDEYDLYFRRRNDSLRKQGVYLEIIRWEYFLDAMTERGLQDEYNKAICNCDIFVSLFWSKTGRFTEEEFDTAHRQFVNTGKPLIYTFFKKDRIDVEEVNREEIVSLYDFKEKLKKLGHYYTSYNNTEHLKRQFSDQLGQLIEKIISSPENPCP